MEEMPDSIDFFEAIPKQVEDIDKIEKRLDTLEKGFDVLVREQKAFHQKVLIHLNLEGKNLQ